MSICMQLLVTTMKVHHCITCHGLTANIKSKTGLYCHTSIHTLDNMHKNKVFVCKRTGKLSKSTARWVVTSTLTNSDQSAIRTGHVQVQLDKRKEVQLDHCRGAAVEA